MTLLLQISDTHFGTERAGPVEALVQLTQELAPDVVVLSGDITQRATRCQFRAARAFVDRLGKRPLIAIPGNHDVPLFNLFARLFSPYANHVREFGPELEPEFESEHMLVVALKTTRRLRHKDGAVSTQQVERVARRLERAGAAQLRIVVTHQPIAVTRPQDETNVLHGHAEAVLRWAWAGADLILGGHIHLPFVLGLRTLHANLPREVWAVQAGTAVSSRVRHEAGNSVNVVRYADHRPARPCVVERWDYREVTQRFEAVAVHALRCGSADV